VSFVTPSRESALVHAPFALEGRRLLLLADGSFAPHDAKTAVCIAMYRPHDVVAVLDATRAGRTVRDALGFGGDAPIVATLDEGLARRPEVAIVGIAPAGGEIDAATRAHVAGCLRAGLDVASGMHVFLADDPELAALARASGARVWDVRRVPEARVVSDGRGCTTGAKVVLTVGTDCSVGKMTVTVELERAARASGLRSAWAATGQTGILLRNRGVPVDRVVADFVGGVTQALVDVEGRDADVVLVEGQGAVTHPGFAGVALGILYGAMPDAMVLVHDAGRARYKRFDAVIPPLADVVALHEALMRPYKASRVAAIALNTRALGVDEARHALARAHEATGLPAFDVVRFGAQPAWEVVRAAIGRVTPVEPSS
jgi:uncharacterized NAD-dependent epimerase/dehydratase family protein